MASSVSRDIKINVKLLGDEEVRKRMTNLSLSFGNSNTAMLTKASLITEAIKKAFEIVIDYAKEAYDASVEFESAMAGVAKTMDISDVKLEHLGDQLMELSERIPTTATELAGLAEIAGQLGIAEDDVIDFVEVVAAMGVSTNVSAEDAATAFARIANIFGTSASDYERMGSTIVDLGNKFATTESEIIDMAYNMAGMGATVGLTEADIFALATALTSLGIASEAGGSSMQKLFQYMEEAANAGNNLEEFAYVAQMTEEAFANLWNNDPSEAILAVMEGLNQIDASGDSMAVTLKTLGINEIRLTRSTTALANGYEVLLKAMSDSETAWEEGSALSTEAGKRYATSESRVQIAKNKTDNLKIEVGDVYKDLVVGTAEVGGDVASWLRELIGQETLTQQIESASASIESEKQVIEQTASEVRILVGDLLEMGDVTTMSESDATRYFAILETIAKLMPTIGVGFNLETGEIYNGVEALNALVDSTEEAAKLQVDYEAQREAADAYVIELEKQQEMQKELIVLDAKRRLLQERYNELEEETKNKTYFDPILHDETIDAYADLVDVELEIEAVTDAIAESQAELDKHAGVVEEFEEIAEAYAQSADTAASGTAGFSDEVNLLIAQLNELDDNLLGVIDNYNTVYNEIKSNLDTKFGGFTIVQPVKVEKGESVSNLIQRLKDQQAYMEQYQENLEIVQELGLDSDIIEQYLDGSTDSASMLELLANAAPEEVEALNTEYKKAGEARDALAKSLAEAQTGLETSVAAIVTQANELIANTDAGNDMYQNGIENIQALINGMNAKIPALIRKTNQINSIVRSTGSGSSGGTTTEYYVNGDDPVSHAAGLSFVPFDGYLARLHKGEMVLTALEAKAYRAEQYVNYEMMARMNPDSAAVVRKDNTDNSVHVEFGNITIRDDGDITKLSRGIAKLNRKNARGVGAR